MNSKKNPRNEKKGRRKHESVREEGREVFIYLIPLFSPFFRAKKVNAQTTTYPTSGPESLPSAKRNK